MQSFAARLRTGSWPAGRYSWHVHACSHITLELTGSVFSDERFMYSLGLSFDSSLMASGSAPWQYQASDAAQFYAAADQLLAGYKRPHGSELQVPLSGEWCSGCGRIAAAWADQGQIDAARAEAVAQQVSVISLVCCNMR